MKTFAALVCVALGFVCASSAQAEPEPGTRIDMHRGAVRPVDREDSATARRVMNTFGRCVARNRQRQAQTILGLPLRSDEQLAAVRAAIGGEDGCMGYGGGELRFSPQLLVGAMAEFFVAERLPRRDLGTVAGMTDERLAEMGLTPRTVYEDIAICVAARDPSGVMSLARSEPESEQESGAIARLMPHLGPCFPEDQTVSLNRSGLRSLVSVGLYRLLAASPDPVPAAQPERR